MADYLAGQAFFDFYPTDEVEADEPAASEA